jgi:hypothetical protein
MMTAPGYGQPMMHGIMPPQVVMQQQQQQQQQQPPPPPPQQQAQQQHPAQQQDDLAVKVKRSFTNFDTSLKVKNNFECKNIYSIFCLDIPT